MSRIERVEEKLKRLYPDAEIQVKDETHKHIGHREILSIVSPIETHLEIIVCHPSLSNRKTIEVYKEINKELTQEFKTGLHAVTITCLDSPPE